MGRSQGLLKCGQEGEAKAWEEEVKEDEWRVTVNPIFIESNLNDKQRVPGLPATPCSPDQFKEVRWEGGREGRKEGSEAASFRPPANSECWPHTSFKNVGDHRPKLQFSCFFTQGRLQESFHGH